MELNTYLVISGFAIAIGSTYAYIQYSRNSKTLTLAGSTIRRTKTIDSETVNKNSRNFAFSLLVTLFTVFLLFNWTFYNEGDKNLEDFLLNEELTIVAPKITAAPPPPSGESVIDEIPKEETIVEPVSQPIEKKITEKPIEKIDQPISASMTNAPVTSSTSKDINSTSIDPNGKGPVTNNVGEEAVLMFAEQMPRFPGCDNYPGDEKIKQTCSKEKLRDYITKNLTYPPDARINKIEGVVYVKFIVDKDGSINNVSLVKDLGYNLGEAAKKLVENMNKLPQKWTPAYQNGKPVRVLYTLPVSFKLNKTNSILK